MAENSHVDISSQAPHVDISLTPPTPTINLNLLTSPSITCSITEPTPGASHVLISPAPRIDLTTSTLGPSAEVRITSQAQVRAVVQGGSAAGSGGGGGGFSKVTRINHEAIPIYHGQPVKFDGSDGCKFAQADVIENIAIGIADNTTLPGGLCEIIMLGFTSSGDWTAATGGSATLSQSTYFLSQGAAGIITTIPPDSTGQICQYIGISPGPGELMVQIGRPMRV